MTDLGTSDPTGSALQHRLGTIVQAVFGGSTYAAAIAADVEPSTVQRLVEGRIRGPRMTTVQRLARAFNVPVGWLLDEAQQLPEEVERGHSPTEWLLIDRFFGQQQEQNLGWLRGAQPADERHRKRIDAFWDYRRTVESEAWAELGRLELFAPETARSPSAWAEYRARRSLEAAALAELVAALKQSGVPSVGSR
jgi:transcriptional regulator with XRE-family HTH domain